MRSFNRDHPHVRSPAHAMSCDELRFYIRFLLDRWPPSLVARLLAIDLAGLKSKLRRSWIYPGEQLRFTKAIDRILAGELRPVKIGRTWHAELVERPVPIKVPPRMVLNLETMRLHYVPPRITRNQVLPAFHTGFNKFETWDPDERHT